MKVLRPYAKIKNMFSTSHFVHRMYHMSHLVATNVRALNTKRP